MHGPQLFIHHPLRDTRLSLLSGSFGHVTEMFIVQVSVVCASSFSWVCPQQWSVESRVPVGLPSGAAAPQLAGGVLLVGHHSDLLLAASLAFLLWVLFSGTPHSSPGVAQADSGTSLHICPIGFIYINPFTLRLQTASSLDVGIFLP